MKHTKTLFKSIGILLCFGFFFKPLLGQDSPQLISLSPLVGKRIDSYEYFKYRLQEIYPIRKKDFVYAEILKINSGTYRADIHQLNGEVNSQFMDLGRLKKLRNKIDRIGKKIIAKLDLLRPLVKEGKKPRLRLTFRDNNQIAGEVLQMGEDGFSFTSQFGESQVQVDELIEIELEGVDYQPNLQYGFSNPNATRYLFAPSAFPLKKGEGYYQNIWVLLNSVNVGISDHLSITGGIELISTLTTISGNGEGILAFTNIKASTQLSDELYVGGGVLAGGFLGGYDFDEANMAIAYGLLTLGNEEHNATLGLGYGAIAGDWARRPIIVLNGMTRLSRRVGLVSENWFLSSRFENTSTYYDQFSETTYTYTNLNQDTYMAFSGAVRLMGEKITFDIGLIGFAEYYYRKNTESNDQGLLNEWEYDGSNWAPIPIPFLDFVYKF